MKKLAVHVMDDVSAETSHINQTPHLVSQRIATRLNATKVGDFPRLCLAA
jgi:hypothetical protein